MLRRERSDGEHAALQEEMYAIPEAKHCDFMQQPRDNDAHHHRGASMIMVQESKDALGAVCPCAASNAECIAGVRPSLITGYV